MHLITRRKQRAFTQKHPEANKIEVSYDHKFSCLIIELEREEIALTAKKICEQNNREDLLNHHIRSILYRVEEDGKKKPITLLTCLVWVFVSIVIISGIYKVFEIIKNFI